MLPDPIHFLPKVLSSGVCGEVLDPEINTENTFRLEWRFFRSVNHGSKIEYAILVCQVGLALHDPAVQVLPLIFTASHRNSHTPFAAADGNPVKSLP
ncbi:MAG: hypothetical protein ABSB29_02710 [Nitrososphaerales archaeon]|jgi:hypothetical protein